MEMLDRRIRNDVSTHEYFYFLQKKKKKEIKSYNYNRILTNSIPYIATHVIPA